MACWGLIAGVGWHGRLAQRGHEGATPATDPQAFYGIPPIAGPTDNAYRYPKYLFLPPDGTNAYPDPVLWTFSPTEATTWADEQYGTPSLLAPIWQHMPWTYMQALIRAAPST